MKTNFFAAKFKLADLMIHFGAKIEFRKLLLLSNEQDGIGVGFCPFEALPLAITTTDLDPGLWEGPILRRMKSLNKTIKKQDANCAVIRRERNLKGALVYVDFLISRLLK
jgi:hypothetical protein